MRFTYLYYLLDRISDLDKSLEKSLKGDSETPITKISQASIISEILKQQSKLAKRIREDAKDLQKLQSKILNDNKKQLSLDWSWLDTV